MKRASFLLIEVLLSLTLMVTVVTMVISFTLQGKRQFRSAEKTFEQMVASQVAFLKAIEALEEKNDIETLQKQHPCIQKRTMQETPATHEALYLLSSYGYEKKIYVCTKKKSRLHTH